MTHEEKRLKECREGKAPWRLWGPYLSERQWGTVREDYSPGGTAWDSFSHDHSRSRAYRWGEDGIAGFSDESAQLCMSLALWNGKDPILKERMFGLTNSEGNHGEDVKDLYYYLDATPTHSYLKMLYKYPQREFPYGRLCEENRRRGGYDLEFEMVDSDAFQDDRYWDVFVEYAKEGPADIFMKITVHNRGPERAELHILPQLFFRNTWSWGYPCQKPEMSAEDHTTVVATHPQLGEYRFTIEGCGDLLFCDNETNTARLFGQSNGDKFPKDAFHEYVVHGNHGAVNPHKKGTKAAGHCVVSVDAGGSAVVRARLRAATNMADNVCDEVVDQRKHEADQFYQTLQKDVRDDDSRLVQRQALAGMIWSKQFFYYDIPQWLNGDPAGPPPPENRKTGRNWEWAHLNNADILSMPDKWEYPVVCGLGSGVPHAGHRPCRRGFRQESARADDARMVHASERAAAGL